MLVGCVASKNNSKESIKSILWLALFTGSLCFNYFFIDNFKKGTNMQLSFALHSKDLEENVNLFYLCYCCTEDWTKSFTHSSEL